MNNIAIANETMKITEEGAYMIGSRRVVLPRLDYKDVIVITPSDGEALLKEGISRCKGEKMCRITVVNADSFKAGRSFEKPLVLNFANAHNPGGGFRLGANAQEEALCRCSTLYASITSEKAAQMYRYNNTHISKAESDHMLLSPNVAVFRDEKCTLLDEPVIMGVITAPAPNRYGAAMLASEKLIKETFQRRIGIILAAAAKYGYRDLVLGAWGCGAFGNKAEDVAEYFRYVIKDEGFGSCFDEICFAVYGREDGRNITGFRKAFGL